MPAGAARQARSVDTSTSSKGKGVRVSIMVKRRELNDTEPEESPSNGRRAGRRGAGKGASNGASGNGNIAKFQGNSVDRSLMDGDFDVTSDQDLANFTDNMDIA